MAQGFASQSKERRTQLAKKGGQAAHKKGKAHKYSPHEAKANSAKGVAARRKKQVLAAALSLIKAGITASQLNILKVTEDEYIKYAKDPGAAAMLLRLRLEDLSE